MKQGIMKRLDDAEARIPSVSAYDTTAFFIEWTDEGYEVEAIVSNDFGHMPEAIIGNEQYLVSDTIHKFDTIQDTVSFLEKECKKCKGIKPTLTPLGVFTKEDMEEIRKVHIILLSEKWFEFLYGIHISEEYHLKIIDMGE